MYLRSRSLTALLSIATVLLGGCLDRPLRPINPCTVSGVVNEVAVEKINEIDLLFLVDNSASMREEQQALISEIPRLVEILAGGDLDGDTIQDFEPVSSIQVGIITSDMGIGGVDIPAAARCGSVLGDDGVLIDLHRGSDGACPTEPAVPAFLTFMAGTDNAATFAASVGCLADTGSDGCSFEQQLEAVLKALTPADSTVTFPQFRRGVEVRRTTGHGGSGVNSGFLRANSLLAVIVVTDEDDCSSSDLDLYDVTSGDQTYPVPRDNANMPAPQRQCATYRNVQYDVMTRYVDGILALRPGQRPDFTIFATISGVDPDVLDANSRPELVNGIEVTTVDIEAILADASMIERANAQNNDLEPSCVRPNPMDPGNANLDNEAYPPRRLLEVTRGLIEAQAGGVVASICQARDAENGDYTADFSDAVQSIVARIAASLPTSCLPRPLIRGGDNTVFCQILEVLPEGSSCAEQEARGREPEAVRMEGTREVCRVNQVVPTPENIANGQEPSGLGWFYDDYSAELDDDCFRFEEDNRQQIRFTTGAESIPGAKFRLECVSPVVPTGDVADIGSECAGGNQAPCDLDGDDLASFRSRYDREGASLVCDNVTNTCQFACATDADCPGGNVCFGSDDGNEGNNAYCVSPTCQF